jgi:hypothetical protein
MDFGGRSSDKAHLISIYYDDFEKQTQHLRRGFEAEKHFRCEWILALRRGHKKYENKPNLD